jgi:hypothetical protein
LGRRERSEIEDELRAEGRQRHIPFHPFTSAEMLASRIKERVMGEAKRKKHALEAALRDVQAEGQGVWTIDIVFPPQAPELLRVALGEPGAETERARRMLTLLEQAVATLPQQRPLCLLCDHEFTEAAGIGAWAMLLGAVDQPRNSIMSALCYACAGQDNLIERVAQKYKDGMIPDLRILATPSRAGHA